jgi:hypothetical protein
MTTIYLSYRSDDISATGESAVQALARRYGAANLIVDMPAKATDADYMLALDHAIKHADVVLALIGVHWLRATDATGRRKLENTADVVRFELATALQRRKPLLVLLSDGAVMPAIAELPAALDDLPQQPAHPLTAAHLTGDLDRLFHDIDAHVQHTQQRQVNALVLVIGIAIALMLFLPFFPLAIIILLMTIFWGNVLATRARQQRWHTAMFAPLVIALAVVIVNVGAFIDPFRRLGFIVPGLLLCAGAEIIVLLAYALRHLNASSQ